MKIEIPKKHCDECWFFTHHGNYEKNFCGLYMKMTNNDTNLRVEKGVLVQPKRKKPAFCKQISIEIKETK